MAFHDLPHADLEVRKFRRKCCDKIQPTQRDVRDFSLGGVGSGIRTLQESIRLDEEDDLEVR